MASYIESFASKLDWAMPFQRTGAFPLDRTNMFSSYADAVKYAKGDSSDPDSRGLQGTSYIGQIISVYENDIVTVYKITADRTLSEVGTATNGDDKSIVLSDGLLKLYGFDTATEGQQPRIKNIGTAEDPKLVLEWYTPDTSSISGLQEVVGQHTEALNKLNGDAETEGSVDYKIAQNNKNYYNKSEIDGKISGALHYKGTYATFAALQAAVADGTITPAVGDVYNITTGGGVDSHGTTIKSGDNVICASFNAEPTPTATWDVSSGVVDLSNYYTKEEANAALDKKVDKAEGSRLMTEAEGTKLQGLVKVEASSENGKIKLDGTDTAVYTLPTATASVLGGVKSTADTIDKIIVEADGTMTVYQVSGSKVNGAVSEAGKTTGKLTIGTTTFDGSANVTIDASKIPLPDTLVYKTQIATEAAAGLVKASASSATNGVSVATDGTMTVNNIAASKIEGAVAEASKVTHALTFGSDTYDGSAAKVITAASIGAMTTAAMVDYVKFTDIASDTKAGVVKSTTDTVDKIKVETDGTMSIYQVSGNKVSGAVDNANKLGNVAATDILVAGGDSALTAKVKNAATADALATARQISLTGDATGSAEFNGSADAQIAVTLPTVNANVGAFTKVTVNAKGLVTAAENLSAADIPDLTLSKITDAGTLAGKSEVSEADLDEPLTEKITNLNSNSHTHANKTVLDGITSVKVTAWDNAVTTLANKADKATTLAGYGITDAYTKEEVNGMIGGAFHYKGTYATLAALNAALADSTISFVAIGDVYNITTAGGTDANGTPIKAGDNVVARKVTGDAAPYTVEWDVLSGTVDLSAYYNKTEIDGKLDAKADKAAFDTVSDKVDALDTTVNDAETGLVKKVGDNTTAISQLNTKVSGLENVVGADASSGLQKAVADNTAAITKLNGNESTEGSVRQLIAASANQLNEAITQITEEDTGTIDTRIDAHNTSPDAHTDLFAAKQNKAIKATIAIQTTDWTENEGDYGVYKCAVTVAELAAGKNYSASGGPDLASCAVVAAAQFYPVIEMNANVLTLYCVNKPTAVITINATFLEIQA